MITIDHLKEQYIDEVLKQTPYAFNILTDVGDYKAAQRNKNTVTQYINGLFYITASEVQKLSGDDYFAYAYSAVLELLIPIGDWATENGAFPDVATLRQALSGVLQKATSIAVSDGETMYVGGVSYTLPLSGQRDIRDGIGDSIIYRCDIAFTFMANGINITDFALFIDGTQVSFTGIKINRTGAVNADILDNTAANGESNGESTATIESTGFKIDFAVPAFRGLNYSTSVLRYIVGIDKGNEPHEVELALYDIQTDENGQEQRVLVSLRTLQMAFGGAELNGSGVSNIAYNISLVPYTPTEDVGG